MNDISRTAPLRVAFVVSPSSAYSNVFSGVVQQALAWAKELRKRGVTVDFPTPHEPYDWKSCDLVHLFHYGGWAEGLISNLRRDGIPIVLSPIVDRPTPYGWRGYAIARVPFERLGLEQKQRMLFRHAMACSAVLARSELEARSFLDLGIPRHTVQIVRLGVDVAPEHLIVPMPKSRHVFHMSHLDQPRKNVCALIEACRKLDVPVRLAGKISDHRFAEWLRRECDAQRGLQYLGPLSEARKWQEMRSAAVFCLPSLNEGVGLVALEAYLSGANVVITERSGGTEYFGGDVEVCDPASVADIARCLSNALAKPVQEAARIEELDHLSSEASAESLLTSYGAVMRNAEGVL